MCQGLQKTEFRQKRNFGKAEPFSLQEKPIFLTFKDLFTFSNACAIQIKLGTNELLKKDYASEVVPNLFVGAFVENAICSSGFSPFSTSELTYYKLP